jgi:hypothetical protein
MKNIHVLPTDKPSRLLCNHTLKSFCFQKEENGMFVNDGKVSGASFWSIEKAKNNGFNPQHIYIINDEEIKEGDWVFHPIYKSIYQWIENAEKKFDRIDAKKIILTTDQDLNGVQAIDDEFLEWFVKNPSCEEVKTRKIGEEWIYNAEIPKEEPKQECHICKHCGVETTQSDDECYAKQETLEEAAEKEYGESKSDLVSDLDRIMYKCYMAGADFGAKWQQQDKNKYSEEDMLNFAWYLVKNIGQYSCDRTAHFESKYLEQFKKK